MEGKAPRKPAWIRAKAPTDPRVFELKRLLRERSLHTVCEEASCPNLGECFARGTATFMIMGDNLHPAFARSVTSPTAVRNPWTKTNRNTWPKRSKLMGLKYVVITSVDRDDLRDGGAGHFRDCISAVRPGQPPPPGSKS